MAKKKTKKTATRKAPKASSSRKPAKAGRPAASSAAKSPARRAVTRAAAKPASRSHAQTPAAAPVRTAPPTEVAAPRRTATERALTQTSAILPIRPKPVFTPEAWLVEAYRMARQSLAEGGIPIGAVLVDREGQIVSRGYNRRVQDGDPTAHAEMMCLRNAGRRTDWRECTLVTTLSPCIMCSGATLLFGIPRVVIGENRNYLGAENLLTQHGVKLTVLQDERCREILEHFIAEFPDVWNEDIGLPAEEEEPEAGEA